MTINIRKSNEALDWYKNQIKTETGSGILTGNYCLVSFDGGETWYNSDRSKSGGWTNLHPADPALLKRIKAIDALCDHQDKLNLSNPADQELLHNAGFTIEKK